MRPYANTHGDARTIHNNRHRLVNISGVSVRAADYRAKQVRLTRRF